MGLLFLLAFLLVPAGAISLVYLIVIHARKPAPSTDPNPPQPSRRGEGIAWILVLAGAVAAIFIYFIGGALAIQ